MNCVGHITMQCQCDRKTLTNVEYVRIWKEAVVCSFVFPRVGILRKSTKAQTGYSCRWWYITWRWFPTTVYHYEAVRTYPRFDRHCSSVRCRQMSLHPVRTFEMYGMNVPVNGIEVRSGQEFKNLLLKFQWSSYRVLYKTRHNIATTHTSLVDIRFRGDMR